MNYRHIYHAGNFADVFKHLILCYCLEKLHEKTAPFFVLDTHAGNGKYSLSDYRLEKTNEANFGIKKILSQKNFYEILPESYSKILAKINLCEINQIAEKALYYPGSPLIIKNFLRSQDRAIFAEINREVFYDLKRNFAGNQKVYTSSEDGFALLKSKLPPLEKRGLILIDPSYEKDQDKISIDYEKVISFLSEAQKRFANGIYLLWHPIIDGEEKFIQSFYQKIIKLGFEKTIHVIFDIGKKKILDQYENKKMHANGVFIFNAPWQIEERLNMVLPKILEILKIDNNAKLEIKTYH